MGIGPVFARAQGARCLDLTVADIDLWELNGRSRCRCCIAPTPQHLMDRLNVNGGAVAVGHPMASAVASPAMR
jgi:acetyl-CoA C-acetyltransferase